MLNCQDVDTNINDDNIIETDVKIEVGKKDTYNLDSELEALKRNLIEIKKREETLTKDLEQKESNIMNLKEEKRLLEQELNTSRSKVKSFKKELNDVKKERDVQTDAYEKELEALRDFKTKKITEERERKKRDKKERQKERRIQEQSECLKYDNLDDATGEDKRNSSKVSLASKSTSGQEDIKDLNVVKTIRMISPKILPNQKI